MRAETSFQKRGSVHRGPGQCVVCGETFAPTGSNQKCCSPACSRIQTKRRREAAELSRRLDAIVGPLTHERLDQIERLLGRAPAETALSAAERLRRQLTGLAPDADA
jgi:predicted nucleic acid-binding Zn ribbon protein